jgi:ComF family protein
MLNESTSATSRQWTPPPHRFRSALHALADSLIAVVVSPACAACSAPLARPTHGAVCAQSWSAVLPFTPPFCHHCGDPLPSWRVISLEAATCARCRRRRSHISSMRAVGMHSGALRTIVHALKYGGRPSVARPLARLMAASAPALLDGVDLVVPVPPHRSRHRARGFNQAEELARHLETGCVVKALRRTRPTPSQTDLPEAQRHANVRGAFALRAGRTVTDCCVLLVDDVCTTGATLEACAAVLAEAGAREVRALTAARVVSRPR